jgi:hypothetical protein
MKPFFSGIIAPVADTLVVLPFWPKIASRNTKTERVLGSRYDNPENAIPYRCLESSMKVSSFARALGSLLVVGCAGREQAVLSSLVFRFLGAFHGKGRAYVSFAFPFDIFSIENGENFAFLEFSSSGHFLIKTRGEN